MRQRWRERRGLAEIVGTLMLVLIVVAAATAFSFFVASYQQALQSQENDTHLRDLEVLNVLSVDTVPVPGGSVFQNMTITVGSGDINTMFLTDFLIDGNVVTSYNATIVETGSRTTVGILPIDTNQSLEVPALDQVVLNLSLYVPLSGSTPYFSFLAASEIPTSHSYLELQFYTQRGSLFSATYVPPTALASISYVEESSTGGSTVEVPLLDGATSFQEGGNATIVNWTWTIDDLTTPGPATLAYGAEVELPTLATTDTYSAELAVTNSLGLFGVSVTVDFQG